MKKSKLYLLSAAMLFAFSGNGFSQLQISSFDDLSLQPNSYWIGNQQGSNDFRSGSAIFSHNYDTTYYSWSGFAYSNIIDTVTSGWSNQYASRAGSGADSTTNYALFYAWGNDSVLFDTVTTISGLFITNSTYAALSMQYGDSYSKKFGGETGSEPDWFLLNVFGYDINNNLTDTIEFYLADYRFEDNSQDYIVTNWEWLDLTSLGEVTYLKFALSSTDNGDWGMNTPAYFCFDEITPANGSFVSETKVNNMNLLVYPNPFINSITIDYNIKGSIEIFNITGQIVYSNNTENLISNSINLESLPSGIYLFTIRNKNMHATQKLIKQ